MRMESSSKEYSHTQQNNLPIMTPLPRQFSTEETDQHQTNQ